MAAKKQQTHAKRARELAVKEKRERKRAKKAENAALRALGIDPWADLDTEAPDGDIPESEDGEDADAPDGEAADGEAQPEQQSS